MEQPSPPLPPNPNTPIFPGQGEERVLRLLESITDGFAGLDADWRFTYLNPAAKRILSPDVPQPEDLLGRNFWEMFPETRETVIEAELRGAVTKVTTAEFEVLYPPWNRWFSARAYPVEGGGLSVFFRDVTARKEAEALRSDLHRQLASAKEEAERAAKAIEEAAERFRLFSEIVSLQVWTALPNGKLDYANPHVAVQFGLDLERDVLGDAWTGLIHPDDLPQTLQRWQHSLTTGEHYGTEFRMRMKDGEYRWIMTRAEPMRNEQGRIIRWYGSNTDIHDLKIAQRAFEAASKAKDDFLAALSHELRTPLTPVLMAAEELCNDSTLPQATHETLCMMRRNIELEARLIDDMLDLTRITNGKLALREQECELHSVIRLAIEIVREDVQAKALDFDLQLSASQTCLRGDPARLQQAFWNLLKNAVKFTRAGDRISIKSSDEGDGVAVVVSDTGVGLEREALDRIFLPFEQAGRTNDHRFGGLGLGLAITRTIVEMHGGTIRADSAGPEKGATFCIHIPTTGAPLIPLAGRSLASSIEGSENASAAALNSPPLRVLLVEDHEPTLAVLARLLQRAGHTVFSADCVAEANAVAARESVDLVISDIGLPDGTGIDLMAGLQKTYGLQGIALSGYGMEEDLRRSREVGFVIHLVKPVDFSHLRRSLAELAASRWGGSAAPLPQPED